MNAKMTKVVLSLSGFALFGSLAAHAQVASDVQCVGCVGTSDIANLAISSPKIANGVVTAVKLANGAVTEMKLAPNAVTSTKITAGSVTDAKLAGNSVDSSKIKNGSVAFEDLSAATAERLNGAVVLLTTLGQLSTGESVAAAQCPSDRIAISASCACNSYSGLRNYGYLDACLVTSSGAIAACKAESYIYNPFKLLPEASVMAVCLGATRSDGLPWLPIKTNTQVKDLSTAGGGSGVAPDHEATLARVQQEVSSYARALKSAKPAP